MPISGKWETNPRRLETLKELEERNPQYKRYCKAIEALGEYQSNERWILGNFLCNLVLCCAPPTVLLHLPNFLYSEWSMNSLALKFIFGISILITPVCFLVFLSRCSQDTEDVHELILRNPQRRVPFSFRAQFYSCVCCGMFYTLTFSTIRAFIDPDFAFGQLGFLIYHMIAIFLAICTARYTAFGWIPCQEAENPPWRQE